MGFLPQFSLSLLTLLADVKSLIDTSDTVRISIPFHLINPHSLSLSLSHSSLLPQSLCLFPSIPLLPFFLPPSTLSFRAGVTCCVERNPQLAAHEQIFLKLKVHIRQSSIRNISTYMDTHTYIHTCVPISCSDVVNLPV